MLQCDCCCSVLVVEKDEEGQFYFAIFKQKFGWRLSLTERFRWIKHILLKGEIWNDNLILSKSDTEKLKNFLNESSK